MAKNALKIRVHGRGGQGVVVTSELITMAAFHEGKFCRGFPLYGSQRRGSPLVAFALIAPKDESTRSFITKPTHLIILDPELPKSINVITGLLQGGVVVQNTHRTPDEAKDILKADVSKIAVVDATSISLEIMGLPIPNTATLGAFSKTTKSLQIESIVKAIEERYPGEIGEKNVKAAQTGYDQVQIKSFGVKR